MLPCQPRVGPQKETSLFLTLKTWNISVYSACSSICRQWIWRITVSLNFSFWLENSKSDSWWFRTHCCENLVVYSDSAERSRAEPDTSRLNYTWHEKPLLPGPSLEKSTATLFITDLGNLISRCYTTGRPGSTARLSLFLESSPQSLLSSFSFLAWNHYSHEYLGALPVPCA